jgi:hypothetical protein
MSVIMMMRVSGDPARFEETVAAKAEAIGRALRGAPAGLCGRLVAKTGSLFCRTRGPPIVRVDQSRDVRRPRRSVSRA